MLLSWCVSFLFNNLRSDSKIKLEYLWICTQELNKKFNILSDVKHRWNKKRWFELEDKRTGDTMCVPVFFYNGNKTYLINESVLSGEISNRYIFAKQHGNVLMIEDKDF